MSCRRRLGKAARPPGRARLCAPRSADSLIRSQPVVRDRSVRPTPIEPAGSAGLTAGQFWHQRDQRAAAVTRGWRLRADPDQTAGHRHPSGRLPALIVRLTVLVAGSIRDTRAAELVGDPHRARAGADRVWPVADGYRGGHRVGLRVDPRDRPVEAVRDPHRAVPDRDRCRPRRRR